MEPLLRRLVEYRYSIDDITALAYTNTEAFNTFLSLTRDTSL